MKPGTVNLPLMVSPDLDRIKERLSESFHQHRPNAELRGFDQGSQPLMFVVAREDNHKTSGLSRLTRDNGVGDRKVI